MTVGDTLLKITDYPFAYSLVFILIGLAGYNLSDPRSLAFFALAGFAGTFLAIVDPFGKGIRLYFMSFSQNRFRKAKNRQVVTEWNYFRSAFFTKSIEIEKDKLVSNIYFQISIIVFLLAVLLSNTFASRLSLENGVNTTCISCIQQTLTTVLLSVFSIIFGMMIWNGYNMTKKAEIVATYLFCINSTKATRESIENISKFIDVGDWKTAEYWKNIVEDEYHNEEGLQKERNEKLTKHVQTLLESFNKTYTEHEKKNRAITLDIMNNTEQRKTLEEIFKEFEWYDSLIQHLYTDKNNNVFSSFKKYLEAEANSTESYDKWDKEKKSEIDDIINNLGLQIQQRNPNIVIGEDRQIINISLILHDLDNFVYQTSREELIKIERHAGSIWKVRFFDSSSLQSPRNDNVALLKEQFAEKLSVELAHLALKLRKSDIFKIEYETRNKALDELEKAVEIMLKSHQVNAVTLNGSCAYCRNTEFFSKKQIELENEKMREYPSQLFDESEIYTAYKRKKINKSPVI